MKELKEPLLIILVLFVLVGISYNPSKTNKATSKGTASTIGTTQNSSTYTGYSTNQTLAEGIKSAEKSIKDLKEEIDDLAVETKRSPYYGKIMMSRITGLRGDDPDKEYITLSTKLDKNETAKITGWYLKSEITGYYVFIGKAALLPFPFTKTESDVVLQKGDHAYLTKGFSPIGISFRTNKCTGYFEENRTFTPSLPLQCPRPSDEKLPIFSTDMDRNDECIKLVERISRCTTKGNEFIRDLPDTVSESCKDYITGQINYNTCVALHFGDTDFPGKEYRIYLSKFGPLWRKRSDKVSLYDQNGLLVDSISY